MTGRNHRDIRHLQHSLPRSATARIAIGIVLIIGGILGVLPILGFWMIPLGLAVLAIDIPAVRRARRRLAVHYGRWRNRRRPGPASHDQAEK